MIVKRFLFLILNLFWGISLFSQQGFLKVFDSTSQDVAIFLDIIYDNDTLVFYGVVNVMDFMWGTGFYQIDTFGNVLNKNVIVDPDKILTTSYDAFKKIIKTSDGNYAMIGTTDDGNYFLKVNKSLELLSYVYYPSSIYTANSSLVEDGSGFLLVFAKEQSNNSLSDDVLLIKTDRNGQELWRQEYGTYEFNETPSEIIKGNSNNYVICGGFSRSRAEFGDYLLWGSSYFLSIDSSGNELWNWHSDTTNIRSSANRVFHLADNSWLYSGITWEWNDGEYIMRPMLVRMDSNFNIMWEQIFGYLGQFHGWQDLNQTPDGNFVVSGYADLVTTPAYPKAVHYKFTPQGDSIWLRQDSMYTWDRMRVMGTAVLPSGSIISVGFNRDGPYGETGFVMKLTRDGCLDTLNCFPVAISGIESEDQELAIYPNPAHESINIELPVQGMHQKRIKITNLQGQVVMDFKSIDGEVDVSRLSSGFYSVEVITKDRRFLGKFIKMAE